MTATATATATVMHPCPECNKSYQTTSGLGQHRRRVHDYRAKPEPVPAPALPSPPSLRERAIQAAAAGRPPGRAGQPTIAMAYGVLWLRLGVSRDDVRWRERRV
jgi:hypothetical protein